MSEILTNNKGQFIPKTEFDLFQKLDARFPYTNEGYYQAKKWLKSINRWDEVSTTGFSVDGLSIVHTANSMYEQIHSTEISNRE